ncbi:MAG: hypothetical protein M1814_000983 [Vezdaea aestivalis]|nr:MAG: hypothetical protein M1814_000983 [Vezdaea aestivalis]
MGAPKAKDQNLELFKNHLPPTPPDTEDNDSQTSDNADYPLPPQSTAPIVVLDADLKTPDKHVPRDPRLIRLTGVHPFNVEAPLSALFNEGFLTSPELFYVRNHGAVPEVHDQDIPHWEFSVEGLVEKPITLTLAQMIRDYPQLTYPITLVCAGNRRKEQNQVRKSKGFSWGPAGVSTALFTGCLMSEVIKRAKPKRQARYVCMEGADKLPNGYYGTCLKLNWVMDPNRGIMLAHKMNGEKLRPDHGKPLRAVVPGQIGGRSVKWLKKLIVTDEPSDNWYHIYDNRVLPTTISPEESANRPDIWKDERYAIYDLNTNSAIAYPAHDEKLEISKASAIYEFKGYAYSGGGRRISRVELSLDQGKTWRLATVKYPEDQYRDADGELYGGRVDIWWRESSFCWCFWELGIPVAELVDTKDIVLRSMDEGMAVQPKDMYWSVLGMMNNPWFRITVTNINGILHFEHPTQPALMPGGWMEKVKKAGGNLLNGRWGEKVEGEEETGGDLEPAKEIKMTKDGVDTEITLADFKAHNTEARPWFVVNGQVYDGLKFLQGHPGGAQSIISAAGQDATEEFMAIHSENAKGMMPEYHIGRLSEASLKALALSGDDDVPPASERETFLHPRVWTSSVLVSKEKISWDTRLFTFALANPTQKIGLPIGQHLMARLKDPKTSEAIVRSYTPISETSKPGAVELLVKIYFDGPSGPGGKMTKAMDAISVGHAIDFKGPIGKFVYLGGGRCAVNSAERTVKRFAMISGGSGITPIFQVLRAVINDKTDPTECVVLNGNRLPEDILCREELDEYAGCATGRCKLFHTLSKAPQDWDGLRGRVGKGLLEKQVGRHDGTKDTLVLICGPTALEKSAKQALYELGWSDDDILFF